ncbi:MAG: N-acetyltransferase [Pedobacter sp.]|nr:MAG: N-acetyltransferase [Pedobacter sp.]
MKSRYTNHLNVADKEKIYQLWNNEYPKSLSFIDLKGLDDYLKTLSEPIYYLLECDSGEILAWASKFFRENEKWFAIILDEKIHGQGKGTEMLNLIKENEFVLNAWVIDKEEAEKANGKIYKSPLNFYLKNGFKVYPEIRLENEKMSAVKIIWKK